MTTEELAAVLEVELRMLLEAELRPLIERLTKYGEHVEDLIEKLQAVKS